MLSRALALIAYLAGIAGAGIFFLYILGTGSGIFFAPDAAPGPSPWLINVGLLLFFAIQHSGMARRGFKSFIVCWIPPELERSIYVAASGAAASVLVFFWQPLPGKPLWQGPLWIAGISILAALAIGRCCLWLDQATFFGLTQARTGQAEVRVPLCVDGPYRFVRHPLMLGALIAIWAQPIMPLELLMLNVGMTIYILLAIRLEERDLAREFGEEYEKYRQKVPALIPFRILA